MTDFEWQRLPEVKQYGCPKCGKPQECPCSNCAPRHPDVVMWKWDDTGSLISCGHCGFTMHCDAWLDLDMERYQRGLPSLSAPTAEPQTGDEQ